MACPQVCGVVALLKGTRFASNIYICISLQFFVKILHEKMDQMIDGQY
jgi:hypothetical protein